MLNILYEDSDVVVLNKPAGISVHPAPHAPKEYALTTEILKCWPKVASVGDDPLRPGIVHRLDKETSGILVVAKNQRAFEYLKKQFQEHKVEKTYLALAIGKMPQREGAISLPIGRSRKFGKFTTKTPRTKVREAVTKWRLVREYRGPGGEPLSLLEIKPETGRTHQIRVHLAAIGHPVAGDNLYSGKTARKYRESLGRHFLHAQSLHLRLPAGRAIRIDADLPKELEGFLEKLASA